MKRAPAKSAESGWVATARMAESCANDIDCVPPRKSSAERRVRATSPKARVDEAGGGSLISPEPVGAGSAAEMPRRSLPEFRGGVNRVNQRVSDSFGRKLVRVSAVPNGLASRPDHALEWTLPRSFDDEHRPLVLVQATELRDFIVREIDPMAKLSHPMARAASASACQACPDIVQAVSICPVTVLPCLAPRNAGQDKHDGRGAVAVHLHARDRPAHAARPCAQRDGNDTAHRATPSGPRVRKWNSVGCRLPGGWIHAQRVPVSGGRNALGRANRGGIEQQLRKERRAVSGRCGARNTAEALRAPGFQGRVDLLAGRAPARPRSDGTDRACSPSRERSCARRSDSAVCLVAS